MNLEALERFVMDMIDVLFDNPEEYEAEATKSVLAYRFELHRKSRNKIKIHRLPSETFTIPKPKSNRLTKNQVEDLIAKGE